MDEPPAANILILAADRASGRRWAEMLRPCGARLWLAPGEIPPGMLPELIVTDSDPSGQRGPAAGRFGGAEVGTVRIGPTETAAENPAAAETADIQLPEDVTGRELRLACTLLARIVRLRRRERHGAELRDRLREETLSDPLTGLPNRRAWQRTLRQRLDEAAGSPPPSESGLCLAILDLDHFKRINDTHGHAIGDEVLRAAGSALADGLRPQDFVARLGGDEFGLLLWVPAGRAAAAIVERVRRALPDCLVRAATHAVTASAGYHVLELGASGPPLPCPETLYAAADAALRKAKQQGRDRTLGG